MNARPQITSAEPRMRIPAWRSASPKKRNTRPLKTLIMTDQANRAISPKDEIQSLGTDSQVFPMSYLMIEISGWVASSVWVKT